VILRGTAPNFATGKDPSIHRHYTYKSTVPPSALTSERWVIAMPYASEVAMTCDPHGHRPEPAAGVVQVQAVVLEQQLHVGGRKVVRGVPDVEPHSPAAQPASEERQAPRGGVVRVHLELTVESACNHRDSFLEVRRAISGTREGSIKCRSCLSDLLHVIGSPPPPFLPFHSLL